MRVASSGGFVFCRVFYTVPSWLVGGKFRDGGLEVGGKPPFARGGRRSFLLQPRLAQAVDQTVPIFDIARIGVLIDNLSPNDFHPATVLGAPLLARWR